jgi:hypothetical protein
MPEQRKLVTWSWGEALRPRGDHASAIPYFVPAADEATELCRHRILGRIHASRALA